MRWGFWKMSVINLIISNSIKFAWNYFFKYDLVITVILEVIIQLSRKFWNAFYNELIWLPAFMSVRSLTKISNKRPTGHIANLRKQFNSINTNEYHNVYWEKKKKHYSLYENWMVLRLNSLKGHRRQYTEKN